MTKPSIPLGLVFSRTGPYAMMSGEMQKSALMAVDEINQSEEFDFSFAPHWRDPGGVVAAYHTACDDLIREEQVEHIVGCYTSASRKQVIPIVERTERLLWHPARYEGFESSDNVIYVGAAPNHTVVPLVRHMLEHISSDVFCIGSNYVWTWETNRVIREIVTSAGGRVLAERLLELGETAVDHIVKEIIERKPPVVFNTLVGRVQLCLHARAPPGDGACGTGDPGAELQPVRARTQADRVGSLRRMHHVVRLFRGHRPTRKSRVRRPLEGSPRPATAILPWTDNRPMSASCCWLVPSAAPAPPTSMPSVALRQIIATIPRKARSGWIRTTITAS